MSQLLLFFFLPSSSTPSALTELSNCEDGLFPSGVVWVARSAVHKAPWSNQLRPYRPRLPFNLWFAAWHDCSPLWLIFTTPNRSDGRAHATQDAVADNLKKRRHRQGHRSHTQSRKAAHRFQNVHVYNSCSVKKLQSFPLLSLLRRVIRGGSVKSY